MKMGSKSLKYAMRGSIFGGNFGDNKSVDRKELELFADTHQRLYEMGRAVRAAMEETRRQAKLRERELYIGYLASMRYLTKEAQEAYENGDIGSIDE